MTEPTKIYTIEYGSFEVGGSSDRRIDGQYFLDLTYPTGVLEFSFLVTGTSAANFKLNIEAAQDAFRLIRQDIVITQEAEELHAFRFSDNTGLNQDPRIIKQEDLGTTGRSRILTARIEFELPADFAGQAGRRDSSVRFVFSESGRRTLIVSGTYTALDSNSALAQFTDNIDTYVTSITDAAGGTWELAGKPIVEHDDANKILDFEVIQEEIIFNQSSSSLNDPDIVRQVLLIRRNRIAPGDSGGGAVKRFIDMSAQYEASIIAANTQNLKNKWENTIRPWIISNMKSLSGGTGGALIVSDPEFDLPQNRIRANIQLLVIAPGSNTIELEVTTEDRDEHGVVLIPEWSGNPLTKEDFQGPARRIRTTTATSRELGGGGGPRVGGGNASALSGSAGKFTGGGVEFGGVTSGFTDFSSLLKLIGGFEGASGVFGPGGLLGPSGGPSAFAVGPFGDLAAPGGGGKGRFIPMVTISRTTPRTLGLAPDQINVVDKVVTRISEFAVKPQRGGATTTPLGTRPFVGKAAPIKRMSKTGGT